MCVCVCVSTVILLCACVVWVYITLYVSEEGLALYVSGSSKIQTLLPSNVVEIAPQGFKFCNSVEKYLDGNNVWILLVPLTYLNLVVMADYIYLCS